MRHGTRLGRILGNELQRWLTDRNPVVAAPDEEVQSYSEHPLVMDPGHAGWRFRNISAHMYKIARSDRAAEAEKYHRKPSDGGDKSSCSKTNSECVKQE